MSDEDTDQEPEPTPDLDPPVAMEDTTVYVAPDPAPMAPPGVYVYEGQEATVHPVLGTLMPGQNDFTGWTHPEALQALGTAVASGLLHKAEESQG